MNSPIPIPFRAAPNVNAHRFARIRGSSAETIRNNPPHKAWAIWSTLFPSLGYPAACKNKRVNITEAVLSEVNTAGSQAPSLRSRCDAEQRRLLKIVLSGFTRSLGLEVGNRVGKYVIQKKKELASLANSLILLWCPQGDLLRVGNLS